MSIPKQDWTFNSGSIKQIKISQFEVEPTKKVRVVIYHDDNFNPDIIKFQRVKNNIILKLNENKICNNEYFQNTYRDEHASSSDFYEYITVMTPTEPESDEVVDEIHQAFDAMLNVQENELKKKELKLNTKYHLKSASVKPNALLLNGFGSISIERPYILSNPSRIVYDLPNTLTDPKIRNTELQLNEKDIVKIGQFSVNKARVVIYTEDVGNYLPIFSNDNQSLIIANTKKLNTTKLSSTKSNAVSYYYENNDREHSIIMAFDKPIVHSLDRRNFGFDMYFYNVEKYNEDEFKSIFKDTIFANAKIELLPQIGIKLSIPVHPSSLLTSYIGADGRSIKFTVKEPKIKFPDIFHPQAPTIGKKIVIDAGHGGKDCGALSGELLEKDITLEVAKQVTDILVKEGHEVLMTRSDDTYVSLQDRVEISENFAPDLFVSIHVNSSVKPQISGVETHYYHQQSVALAQTVHTELASEVDSPNRGLFKSKFYVINHTTAPAILVEIGFISNAKEREKLTSTKRKKQTAKAIAKGIGKYIEQK